MTPKERADEIIAEITRITGFEKSGHNWWIVKAIAANQINAIITEIGLLHKPEYVTFLVKDDDDEWYNGYSRDDYWEEVKKEVENF